MSVAGSSRWRWLAAALLAQLALRGARGIALDSATHDELKGIHAGWAAIHARDYRFNPNAPLADILQGASLTGLGLAPATLAAPPSTPVFRGFEHGFSFLEANPGCLWSILTRARAATLAVALVLAVLAAAVSWRSGGGSRGAVIALALVALDPGVVGHGHLATQDVVYATTIVLSLVAGERLARDPRWPAALGLGAACGLAMAAKHTGVLALAVPAMVLAPRMRELGARSSIGLGVAVAAAALATLAAAYQLVALPQYVEGARYLRDHLAEVAPIDRARWSGAVQVGRVLAFKPPVAALALVAVGLAAGGWRSRAGALGGLHLVAALASGLAGSYRHLLPIAVCGYVAAAPSVARRSRVLTGALVVALVVESALAHPHELAFTNALAPRDALTGHDVDLGQDLARLDRWRAESGIRRLRVAFFGQVTPDDLDGRFQFVPITYGPDDRVLAIPPDPVVATPDALALSQANRLGLPHLVPEAMAALAAYPMVATVGGTFQVHDLGGDALAHYRLAHLYLLDGRHTAVGAIVGEYRIALARDSADRARLAIALEELRGWVELAEARQPGQGIRPWLKANAVGLLGRLGLAREARLVAEW